MNARTLVARGPGPMLEFAIEPTAEALAELIAAFANSMGGTIVIGMDAKGNVQSDAVEYLESAFASALRLCQPRFRASQAPRWQAEDTPQGQVATITVTPVGHGVTVQGDYVPVRTGARIRRLTVREFEQSQRAASPEFDEAAAVPGATMADMDEAIIAEYERNRLDRGPQGERLSRVELLRDAGAITVDGLPTSAGILLFGKNPQTFFSQVGVVVVRYAGLSMKDIVASPQRYSSRQTITGALPRIVEGTWEAVFRLIDHQPVMNGLERVERHEYPVEAVREAIVNAICHRDYAVLGQRVEIRLFDDRMEIISPGGLPAYITEENMLHEHYSRNPRLVRGLYYWGYIEELGQGIDIIFETLRRDHHPDPVLRDSGRSFTVTMYNSVDQVEELYGDILNRRQLLVIHHLNNNERITNRQYRELCPDVSAETLRLDLRGMVEKGILLKIGSKRGTYYVRK